MPVGNIAPPETIYAIDGVRLGVTAAGVRYQNRDDVVLIEICEGATTAAVTTTNAFCAAPVKILRDHLKQSQPRYLIINTGNANAATGSDGVTRAQKVCEALAQRFSVSAQAVLPYSTGVIGEALNHQAIIDGLEAAALDLSADNWSRAAKGICTTDTVIKLDSVEVAMPDGQRYHITGISKGAGMIRPNMATMLGFVATDANIAKPLLGQMLMSLTEASFNRITVDGDTSTNDCCTLIATGKAADTLIENDQHPHYQPLYDALKSVFVRLAKLIVRDGEGATKFITVEVKGGASTTECCDVAYAVAHSPLVKTAFFASDPNWGRILAAVGYAGVSDLDSSRVNVSLDDVMICERGGLATGYTEAAGQQVMSRPEIRIQIDLGRGDCTDTVYTCDLSYDYVKINADYRS